jgi:hypothetical protein
MTFFARPDLSDIQFKQLNNSTLTLSGTTRIAKEDGLQILGDGGLFIPLVLTGASDGYVLTFRNGVMHLEESAASGDTYFDSQRNTTRSGIPVVNASGTTVNEFLEAYFFPAVPPTSSLSVPTPTREFGDDTSGNLTWSVTKGTNDISLIEIDNNGDGTYNIPINTGLTSGTQAYNILPDYETYNPASPILQTQRTFRLRAGTLQSETTTSTTTLTWRNRRFYFRNNTQYTDSDKSALETIVYGLGGNQAALSTTRNITINNLAFNNEFFYYMYPKLFGLPIFTVNNLLNNAWGNLSIGTLFEISFTNSKGYTIDYYVARSDSRITGTFNISVT